MKLRVANEKEHMTDFTQKNTNRKNCFDGSQRQHREARALRRGLGGAFGSEKKELKEFLVVGTSAEKV